MMKGLTIGIFLVAATVTLLSATLMSSDPPCTVFAIIVLTSAAITLPATT